MAEIVGAAGFYLRPDPWGLPGSFLGPLDVDWWTDTAQALVTSVLKAFNLDDAPGPEVNPVAVIDLGKEEVSFAPEGLETDRDSWYSTLSYPEFVAAHNG